MKKVLKIFSIAIFAILILLLGTFILVDEQLPVGEEGAEAEELADRMLESLNSAAWDSISIATWTFQGIHHYVWYKSNDSVEVRFEDYKVVINTKTFLGSVFKNGQKIEEDKILADALAYFYNDSFWLIAPYKVKDPGTIRKVINHEGRKALLVTYTSGGVTPGDSYLWILDEHNRPVAWKFWVKIIPIGGLKFSWENWVDMKETQISTLHKGIIDISISNLELN